MREGIRRDAVAIMLALATSAAYGQTPSASPSGQAPPPVGTEPAITTATYGDWVLRCQATAGEGGTRKICEVVQTMQVQGQQQPVAQVAFGKAQVAGGLHLVIALPVNIILPSSVSVATGDKDPHAVDLAWRRCLPGACFADALATDDAVGRWRTSTLTGRVQYKDAANRDVTLPLSFRGLAPALDALIKTP